MPTPRLLLTAALLPAALAAQTVVPPSAATAYGGAGGGAPFTYSNYIRFQQAIDASYLKPGLIYGISFRSRAATTSLQERQWQGMRVILSDLNAASVSAMGGTYASNLSTNQTTVFDGQFNMYRPYPTGTGDPYEFAVTIPFQTPYLHIGNKPLLVDLFPNSSGTELFPGCSGGGNGLTMDFSRDSGLYSMVAKGPCVTGPTSASPSVGGFVIQFHYGPILMPYGKACIGSGSAAAKISSVGSSTLGSAFTIQCTGAPTASQLAVLVLGASATMSASLRLPFDLSGASVSSGTNCWQNVSTDILLFNTVAGGSASQVLVIPNSSSIKGLEVFSQWAVDDPGIGSFSTTQGGVFRIH